MALASDILSKISRDFSGGETLPVIEMMTDLQKENAQIFTDRIVRCILYLADGDFNTLADAVSAARKDFRDLIIRAECDDHFGARHRDLSLPFSL